MITEDRFAKPMEDETPQYEVPLNRLYNTRDAARRLGGLSEATVRSYWQRGLLEKLKCGGLNRCSERGILEFLARCKVAAKSRPNNSALALAALRKSRELRKRGRPPK